MLSKKERKRLNTELRARQMLHKQQITVNQDQKANIPTNKFKNLK